MNSKTVSEALNSGRVFVTPFNYQQEVVVLDGEASMTVPDQSLTIRQIMVRYAQGKPLSIYDRRKTLTYTGDDYTPDVRAMDLVEETELREKTALEIQEHLKTLEEVKKKREAKKAADKKTTDESGAGTEPQIEGVT